MQENIYKRLAQAEAMAAAQKADMFPLKETTLQTDCLLLILRERSS